MKLPLLFWRNSGAQKLGWTKKVHLLVLKGFKHYSFRGVVSFLKPGWLRGENVVQVKHFDACTLYFLKNRGGQNHPNHPGNYTSVEITFKIHRHL